MSFLVQPSARRTYLALSCGLLLLVGLLSFRSIDDLDYGIHVATGRWILQNGTVPATDPFSWSFSSHRYIAYHWGFQLILAWLEGWAGLWGPVGLRCLLVILTAGALTWSLKARAVDPLVGVACGILALVAAEPRFAMRPELFTNLFLACTTLAVDRYYSGRRNAVFLLPLIFLCWVNTHIYVLGFAVVLPHIAEDLLRRRLSWRFVLAAGLSVVALFVNPYGWDAVTEPLRLSSRMSSENAFGQHITELASPFSMPLDRQGKFYMYSQFGCWLALLVLSIPAALGLVRLRRFADLAILAAFAGLSTIAIRNLPLFAIAAFPPLVTGLSEAAKRLSRPRVSRGKAAVGIAAVLAVLLLRVSSGAWYASQRRGLHMRPQLENAAIAVEASDFVREHSLVGKGFNNLDVGGTLLLRAPGFKIFIDGRNEVTGEEFFTRYLQLFTIENFLAFAKAEGIEYVVLSHRQALPLIKQLLTTGAWTMAHYDGVAVVLVRKDGPNGSLPEQPLPPPINGPEERWSLLSKVHVEPNWIESLSRWLMSSEEVPESLSKTGTLLLMLNQWPSAERLLLEAAIAAPNFWETTNNLGALYMRLQDWEAASDAYRTVLMLNPSNKLARQRAEESWVLFQNSLRTAK